MQAGVSRVCITPPVGTWQGGYGARTHPSEGVLADLCARALVLDGGEGGPRAAIVSVDILDLPGEMVERARALAEEATGIPAPNIVFCVSHTHWGPVTWEMLGYDQHADQDYLRLLEKSLAGVVAAAARKLQPATALLGRGKAGFNINRRLRRGDRIGGADPDGPVERDVLVVRVDATPEGGEAAFVQANGVPLAVLFRYGCHPTSGPGLDNGGYNLHSDYPGAAAAFVERAYGSRTTALFLQGTCGDVRPNLVRPEGGFRAGAWAEVQAMGRELGAATIAAAERVASGRTPADAGGALAVAEGTVFLPFQMPSAAELEEALAGTGAGRPASGRERAWAETVLAGMKAGTIATGQTAEVQVFRIGPAWLVFLPGQIFVELGWRVREAVAEAAGAPAENIVIVGNANGDVGYVPTPSALALGGYEPAAFRLRGWPGPYVPEVQELLAQTTAALAGSIA
ncbi:MAG: hypothetical protein HY321_21670 [Armatimonadetes bacterium]|nr:hypothetical protein [Armatimonadota bacterium]